MADIAAAPPRVEVDLPGRFQLDEEIGDFGRSVTGPRGRARKGQEEDYCLRRLLLAWARVGLLARPLHIVAPTVGAPDFKLAWSDAELAVEVTLATSQKIQKELTDTENDSVSLFSEDGYVGDAHTREVARLVVAAVDRKIGKYRSKNALGRAHLLVYESADAIMGEVDEIIDILTHDVALAERARAVFEQVHLIVENRVVLDFLGQARTVDLSTNYAVDFFAWTKEQAQKLRTTEPAGIDAINIAEEIESMGRADRRSLQSQLNRLLLHLLKWKFQPDRRSKSWTRSISQARDAIEVLADENPSLAKQISAMIGVLYPKAARMAAQEMSVDPKDLPSACPFTIEEILDPDFLPQ